MNAALLVLRVVVGALFAAHGAQKLFGWFGGSRPRGTASFFESVGLRPGLPLAVAAGAAELTGGAMLAVGFAVPVAAALLAAVMTVAIAAVHWTKGLWNQNGGLEFPLVMATVAFAVAAIGPGSASLDNAFGIAWSGIWWAVVAAGIGLAAGVGAWAYGRSRTERSQAQTPATGAA